MPGDGDERDVENGDSDRDFESTGFVHRHDLCLIALDGNTATQKRGKIRQGNKKQKNKKLKTNQEKTNAHQTVKQKRQRCIN
jgi:hypothetical protein